MTTAIWKQKKILGPVIFRISADLIVACNSVWFYSLNYFEWIIKHLVNEGMIWRIYAD